MKQLFTLLLGNLSLFLVSGAATIGSYFLVPLFVKFCYGSNVVSEIVGWSVVFPFMTGFLASALLSAGLLSIRNIKNKNWWWLSVGVLLLAVDLIIVMKSIILRG